MFSKELQTLIDAAIMSGEITEKTRAVLHKRAEADGVDPDELDMIIDSMLAQKKEHAERRAERKTEKSDSPTALARLLAKIEEVEAREFKDDEDEDGDDAEEKRADALANTIKNFPLPKDKEELLEIIYFIKPYLNKKAWNTDTLAEEEMAKAYRHRYKEICNLVKTRYANDADLVAATAEEKKEKKGFFSRLFGK